MAKRIIYKDADDNLVVLIPTPDCLATKTVEQIAAKDVPSGLAYKIVEDTDVPADRTFRNAWTIADSELTDGTGSEHDMFDDDPAHPDYVAPAEDEHDEDAWNEFVAANGDQE